LIEISGAATIVLFVLFHQKRRTMDAPFFRKNLVGIFCYISDFCKDFQKKGLEKVLPNPHRKRSRECSMPMAEIMTIVVMFHLSGMQNFKLYYAFLEEYHRKDFPDLLSYNRFIEIQGGLMLPLFMLAQCLQGEKTGIYFIDSTPLKVCHNLRIYSHKVFKGFAKRGKSSTGWFFGFKLHLVFNHKGEIVEFMLTAGNVDDRKVVDEMTELLKGWLFGDRGYISKYLSSQLSARDLKLITKVKKNMDKVPLSGFEKYFLRKRGFVETGIKKLKQQCQIEHTRHRSLENFVVNILGAIAAYALAIKKPSIKHNQLGAAPILIPS